MSVFDDIRAGDTYTTKGRTLTEADVEKREREEGPGRGTVRYGVEVKNQDGDTVLSCEMLSLLR